MQKLSRPVDPGFAPTIPNLLRNAVEAFGDRDFLVEDARTLTYAEVSAASSSIARGLLSMGSGKAPRVGLLIPNSIDWVICWLGAARSGALTQPLSTLYKAAEIDYCLAYLDVETLFVAARYGSIDLIERLEQALPTLRDQASTTLRLPSHPYLRHIVVLGETDRAWAIKGLESLRSAASAEPWIDIAFLRQVEDRITPADLASQASALDLPLRADLLLVAQRSRRFLRQAHAPTVEERRVPLRGRPPGRHQSLHQRAQSGARALHLESRCRQDHRRRQTRAPNVGINPLGNWS